MGAEDVGLSIKISADVSTALRSFTQLTDATGELLVEGKGNILQVSQALNVLRASAKEAGNPAELGVLNRAIKDLSAEATRLGRAGTQGFDDLGNKIQDAEKKTVSASSGIASSANSIYGAIRKIANILPGIGIAGVFGLIGTGLAEVISGLGIFSQKTEVAAEKEKIANEEAKKLIQTLAELKNASELSLGAAAGEEGNIDRVRALAAAVQDSNKTYKERENALNQLRETNKAYFGDLTLEASSLATLSKRVEDYSQALITEAIVKGQVEEIAKVSQELEKQAHALDILRNARDRAVAAQAAPKISTASSSLGNVDNTNISEETSLAVAVKDTNSAYEKQRDAVLSLRTAIATYRGELDKAISDQLQQKPLKDAPVQKDDLKDIIPILEQIKRIYDDLRKPDKDPIFKQFAESVDPHAIALLEAQIRDAIKQGAVKGAKDPEIASAYAQLATALGAKLSALQNPNLHARLGPIADIDEKELKEFADNTGKQLTDYMKKIPPIKTSVKVDIAFTDFEKYQQDAKKKLDKLQEDFVNNVRDFTKNIGEQAAISLGKGLGQSSIKTAFDSFMNFLGSSIERLGEQLIIAAGLFSAIDVAVGALLQNPLLAAAAGIAAVAVGAALKKSFKATPFADGGVVTGPTYALIGEAGPEAVFPLDKLDRFMGKFKGNDNNVNVSGQFGIKGNDLILVMGRAQKQRNLVQ